MKASKLIITTANKAVAKIAYKTNDVFPIYPITPASEMSELVEEWNANGVLNMFQTVPSVEEMQSEAGVAGALHGALQTGALSSTFTASQGLLLMLPNMCKIAGELTPNVIHVATRSIARHALSVFGDHSDVMAVRNTGYALLASASVQEAQDFALIAQRASLNSRIPFVHFFDGFRTSHETQKIQDISDHVLAEMMSQKAIRAHRNSALNPNAPVLRGSTQGPDVFFQSLEAANSYYKNCPTVVENAMEKFYKLTGRSYKLFEYVGHPDATHIIISMASSTETIECVVKDLNKKGKKTGLIKVRLYRPFSKEHLLKALPKTCRAIAVLDRTKEAGATGEPLYLDIVQSLFELNSDGKIDVLPKIVGGRYGLSSKEFTPEMVEAVIENIASDRPKNNFTIGIHDDVTHLSLPKIDNSSYKTRARELLFCEYKSLSATRSLDAIIDVLGNENDTFVQAYTETDYKKYKSLRTTHIRISKNPVKAPYLIQKASMLFVDAIEHLNADKLLSNLAFRGTIVVYSNLNPSDFWNQLDSKIQQKSNSNEITFILLPSSEHLDENQHSLHFAALSYVNFGHALAFSAYKQFKAVHFKIKTQNNFDQIPTEPMISAILNGKGDELPVSVFPVDGTFNTHTSIYQPDLGNTLLPKWDSAACIQCGLCSMACPTAALRIKLFDTSESQELVDKISSVAANEFDASEALRISIQINPEQCTSCNNCVDACDSKAMVLENQAEQKEELKAQWRIFNKLPEVDRTLLNPYKLSQQQLQEPLFKYATGEEGCGASTYLKLLSQLFGSRALIANATGSSSIFGGALPTTPWSRNKEGQGPAWSNSLFEDNAELGLGFRLSIDQQKQAALVLLSEFCSELDQELIAQIVNASQHTETEIRAQQERIERLKRQLQALNTEKAKALYTVVDSLVEKSVWIVGGDGWAYDIGFGGIDHVVATGSNVNILILDNEVYANTGGQTSKATPFGAKAKFSHNGKHRHKKDLARMMMAYEDVYVASVSIGANPEHTLKSFMEAEHFNGPSILLAYTHSSTHGIDMKTPKKYHQAAVDSGQWLLFNHNPMRREQQLPALELVSEKPSIPIHSYLSMEERFNSKHIKQSDHGKKGMDHLQQHVDRRYAYYHALAQRPSQQLIDKTSLLDPLHIAVGQTILRDS